MTCHGNPRWNLEKVSVLTSTEQRLSLNSLHYCQATHLVLNTECKISYIISELCTYDIYIHICKSIASLYSKFQSNKDNRKQS